MDIRGTTLRGNPFRGDPGDVCEAKLVLTVDENSHTGELTRLTIDAHKPTDSYVTNYTDGVPHLIGKSSTTVPPRQHGTKID